MLVSPAESAAVVEGKRDEFLGFVESGESFGDAQAAGANAVSATTAPTIAQADNKLTAEPSETENQSTAASTETPNSANQVVNTDDQSASPASENPTAAKMEAKTTAASTENKPTTTTTPATASAGKNGANAVAADGREPFEFEKCTINLNLTLLPAESGKNTRKVIVGAVSHNLLPEIDFLEITEVDDLTQIAYLMREKLARFKQTLPVKYIEQLCASKAKSAKKSAPTKATAAVATLSQPATGSASAEKEIGKQKTQETKRPENEKPQSETTAVKNNTTDSTVPMPTVDQSVAANSIQGSLF